MSTLSVLVPNYNHGQFVERTLRDFLHQTRRPDAVVVLDDASTDESTEVLHRIAAEEPRVRVVHNERNLGAVATMDRLLRMADTDYVYLGGADDRVHPELFERALNLLEANPRAGLCSSLCWIIDEGDRVKGKLDSGVVTDRPGYLPPDRVAEELLRRSASWMVTNGLIWKREALVQAGGFRLELGPAADSVAAMVIALRNGACFIPERLSSWRRRSDGYSASVSADTEAARQVIQACVHAMKGDFAGDFPAQFPDRWAREEMARNELMAAERRHLEQRERWETPAFNGPLRSLVALLATRGSQLLLLAKIVRVRHSHGLPAREGVLRFWRGWDAG